MLLSNVISALLTAALVYSTPINDKGSFADQVAQGNNTTPTNALPKRTVAITGRSIWTCEIIPQPLIDHWEVQRGARKEDNGHLAVKPEEYQEIQLSDGRYVPLLQLDCTNAKRSTHYGGDYYDICRNYLWLRNCDPTTKERIKHEGGVPGYMLLHRSGVYENYLRRTTGGYKEGENGPCDQKNVGAKTNFFWKDRDKHSLEEMNMAFMSEGGRYLPIDGDIGATVLKSGVERTATFRCVNSRENKSAGSRWLGLIRKRKIQRVAPDPKYTKSKNPLKSKKPSTDTAATPLGKHSATYKKGEFMIDVYNWGAVRDESWDFDWGEWDSKCQNDGRQFLGLNMYDEAALKDALKEAEQGSDVEKLGDKFGAMSISATPKKGQPVTGKSPQTPKNKQIPEASTPPGAPRKQATSKSVHAFWDSIGAVVRRGFTGTDEELESIWDEKGGVEVDDEEMYEKLFPKPDKMKPLPELLANLEKNWQYFPAINNGVGDGNRQCGNHQDLHRFTKEVPRPPSGGSPSK